MVAFTRKQLEAKDKDELIDIILSLQSMVESLASMVVTLEGAIELDDAFFSTEISLEERDKPLKRGRGSQKKTKVLVMAESKTVENPKPGKKPKKVRYLK